MTFGLSERADVRAIDVQHRGLDGMTATVDTRHGRLRIETPLLGAGNLANVLAATAVATELDVPLTAIAERASTMKPAAHRGDLLRLAGGITLIDDSYNSSPSALLQALETVKIATGSARKVAILGEMLELGSHAAQLHATCGRAAAAAGLDLLIAVGGDPARRTRRRGASARRHARPAAIAYVTTSAEAAELAGQKVRPGDLVLVKGSRGIRTDLVVDRLKVEYA